MRSVEWPSWLEINCANLKHVVPTLMQTEIDALDTSTLTLAAVNM